MYKKIEAPTNCPECKEALVLKGVQLFCTNSQCSGQQQKKLENFTKSLKIKGFGSATISKLGLESLIDLYDLTEAELVEALGEKIGSKLYIELENSKKASLNDLLPAFSIPLIGKTAATKICGVISHISEINEETCKKAGLGPVATSKLLVWYSEEFLPLLSLLPFSFRSENKNYTKGVVCITGKLKSFKTKQEAEKVLASLGYRTKPSVTKEVSILINESGVESSKTQKARELGIEILTNINELIKE